MHGDSVTLAELTKQVTQPIDVLMTSSMTNLPAFLALNNPRFAHTPKIMYMHDNQFTRPIPEGETRDMTYCYINYVSMLTSDTLLFPSQFQLMICLRHYQNFWTIILEINITIRLI